jgi:hypothetical protein
MVGQDQLWPQDRQRVIPVESPRWLVIITDQCVHAVQKLAEVPNAFTERRLSEERDWGVLQHLKFRRYSKRL